MATWKQLPDLDRENCIWLAGVIEGKAQFKTIRRYIASHNHLQVLCTIKFSSFDKGLNNVIYDLLGGSCNHGDFKREKYGDTRSWLEISGNVLTHILKLVIPYIKSPYNKEILTEFLNLRLTFQDDMKYNNRSNPVGDHVMQNREAIYERIVAALTKRREINKEKK